MPCKWHGWQCRSVTRNDFFNPKGPKMVIDDGKVIYTFCSVYKCGARQQEFKDSDLYTFRGYDPELLTMLPAGTQNSLGAILTRNQGMSTDALAALERNIMHGSNFLSEAAKLDESLKDSYFKCIHWYYNSMAHEAAHRDQLTLEELTAGRNLKRPAKAPSFDEAVSSRAGLSDDYIRSVYSNRQDDKAYFLDVHMAMLSSSILKGDKSYKVTKVVFKDGCRSFDSLYTVMNERNQIVAQYFCRSASMKEVETILAEIKERLELFGYDDVKLFYTDDCCHEAETIEKSLRLGPAQPPILAPIVGNNNNIDVSKMPRLTALDLPKPIRLLKRLSEVEAFAVELTAMVNRAKSIVMSVSIPSGTWMIPVPVHKSFNFRQVTKLLSFNCTRR
jgi:hypothetical protein